MQDLKPLEVAIDKLKKKLLDLELINVKKVKLDRLLNERL